VTQRLVVGITGATGALYGVGLLARARALGLQTHLVATPAGVLSAHHELGLDRRALEALADQSHAPGDIGAPLASGSFDAAAMIVAPCSMRTLAAVAHGLSDNLLTRAADVMLKERRRLVLMVRETPFNLAHLRNMTAATEMGAIVFPPLPAFYHRPGSIDEMVADTVERVLALVQVPGASPRPWSGLGRGAA
jgi:4-hydroxy-3-polyprenylbenzoate decarboxylase